MTRSTLPEVWLRGPVEGISPLLQPVAHALLQAREEITELMEDFPDTHLWLRAGGVASPGFHLQHLTGVLDRIFTYARDESLDPGQLETLAAEGIPGQSGEVGDPGGEGDSGRQNPIVQGLLLVFSRQVDKALEQLKATPDGILASPRGVGRAKLPSTVIGLLVHAAEHTQRHTGQLLVTARIISGGEH